MRRVALVGLLLLGCSEAPEDCPRGRAYVYDFDGDRTVVYSGCDVSREVAEYGAFLPDAGDAYTKIDVPNEIVPVVRSEPTTVSLCSPNWDLRVEHHDGYCPLDPDPNNPIYSEIADGKCYSHVESAQAGVYGVVQLAWEGDHLTAEVSFQAEVEYVDENGAMAGLNYAMTGYIADDHRPEDPILLDPCGCSISESCVPEEPEGP